MMCIHAEIRPDLTPVRMLYEFHRSQNAKRPGAVHATYLVYGTKRASDGPSASQNGTDGDVDMTSSAPEVESLTEVVPTSTLSLVPEKRLKGWFRSCLQ
jgi:DNA polymerase delta subunit 3